jgi:hypothetical protein
MRFQDLNTLADSPTDPAVSVAAVIEGVVGGIAGLIIWIVIIVCVVKGCGCCQTKAKRREAAEQAGSTARRAPFVNRVSDCGAIFKRAGGSPATDAAISLRSAATDRC